MCPSCGSPRNCKNGLRYTPGGAAVQRYLCNNCGARFSWPQLRKVPQRRLNSGDSIPNSSQICELLTEGPKNLTIEEIPPKNALAGATMDAAGTRGLIVQFGVWMAKQGYAEATITRRVRFLTTLSNRGADLNDPESVKLCISQQKVWSPRTKAIAVETIDCLFKMTGKIWDRPNYKDRRKLPFIPSETELNSLIAGCNKKTACYLQLLKETGCRCGEAFMLEWEDFDFESKTVNITPEKQSEPRKLKISNQLIAMLDKLPNKSKPFECSPRHFARTFRAQRKRIATKLGNPRILKIHFHTLRHWFATTQYYKTKNLVYVQQALGHKSILNTQLYIQLVSFDSDDYNSAVAQNIEEAQKLVEAGFEFVCDFEGKKLFRKQK